MGNRYSVCGPVVKNNKHGSIGDNGVLVPDGFYKVLLTRYYDEYKGIGFLFENSKGGRNLLEHAVTIDEVERVTGIDFFHLLPDNVLIKFFMEVNFMGLIIGVATFLIIGLFHPLVIKAEYYLGVRSWWLFLLAGIVACAASLLVADTVLSILLGVVAFSSFWSIGEVFQQRKRVEKGWFPKNPKRCRKD